MLGRSDIRNSQAFNIPGQGGLDEEKRSASRRVPTSSEIYLHHERTMSSWDVSGEWTENTTRAQLEEPRGVYQKRSEVMSAGKKKDHGDNCSLE